jgi:hypothetical protein
MFLQVPPVQESSVQLKSSVHSVAEQQSTPQVALELSPLGQQRVPSPQRGT